MTTDETITHYTVDIAYCGNCAYLGPVTMPLGERVTLGTCPVCRVPKMLLPSSSPVTLAAAALQWDARSEGPQS